MRIIKAAAVIVVAAGAAAGLAACGTARTVAVPGPTVTRTVTRVVKVPGPPVKVITRTVIKDVPTPAPTEGTLLNYSGQGTSETPSFTAGGSGDYTVTWTYSGNNDSSFGSSTATNFSIQEDGGNDFKSTSLPNDIAASGSGNTGVFGDAGRHTFNVQATGSWTVKVVSAP
jgi:hypothetical protein